VAVHGRIRAMWGRLFFVAPCCLCVGFLFGCGAEQPFQPPEKQAASGTASPAVQTPFIYPKELEVSDLWMRQSNITPITGDVRPFWRVHGKIRNSSNYSATRVKLVVHIWVPMAPPVPLGMKTEMVDSGVLEIKSEILPGAVQTFEQEIHLAPPNGKWDWLCQPIEVDAENP
jgi:hypothetical protein